MSDCEESPVSAALCSSSLALTALPVLSYSADSSCTLWGLRGMGRRGGGRVPAVLLAVLLLFLLLLLLLSLLLRLLMLELSPLLLFIFAVPADSRFVEPSFKSDATLLSLCAPLSAMTMDGSEHDSTPRASSYLFDIDKSDFVASVPFYPVHQTNTHTHTHAHTQQCWRTLSSAGCNECTMRYRTVGPRHQIEGSSAPALTS
jgi:hypothetical protein